MTTTPVSLEDLRVFHAVASTGSFTEAARRLQKDKSRLSRVLRLMEQALGVELLVRTTRSVRLSREGAELLARIAPALETLTSAVQHVPTRSEVPHGVVGITSTPDVARALLAPALARFRLQYPRVQVQVRVSHELEALGASVELALRVGRPGADGLVARRLGALTAGFFAAPAYLSRRGVPAGWAELRTHDGLWPRPPRGQRSFAPGVEPGPAAVECADFTVLLEAAVAGAGVALLPCFLAAKAVAEGALVRVLPEVELGGAPLYLVSRAVRQLPPRVAALRTFLLETLRPGA